jgi:hypothetical protein
MRIVPGETQTGPYEKPQDALRAGVLQMMHNYHRGYWEVCKDRRSNGISRLGDRRGGGSFSSTAMI